MLDVVGEVKMVAMDSGKKSMLKLSALSEKQKKQRGSPPLSSPTIASYRLAYSEYLRLPELQRLWSSTEFSEWKGESIIKPVLQSLEITFRFISNVLSDTRHYSNSREWQRRLESLAKDQISIISLLCVDCEGHMEAPTCREKTVVTSDSLLPRLASWHKSEAMAQRILKYVESEMSRCGFTLGLGEANPMGKPCLCYDVVCKPTEVHYLKRNPTHEERMENQTVYTTMQLLETWVYAEKKVLERVRRRIEEREEERACEDCWLLEKMWGVLGGIEDMHLVMDPEDLIRLNRELGMRRGVEGEEEEVWFRSEGLVEITKMSKEMMKEKVPWILEVEVDPKGGPAIVEAAMKIYVEKKEVEKIHLLQAMQGVEGAVKRFYFGFREVVRSVMGSAHVNGSAACSVFMDPSYFPSLDAAKTFLSHYSHNNLHHHHQP